MPLVYIILVNYNGLKDTVECIESLNKIVYNNYKIVVIDNGSKEKISKSLKDKYYYVDFIDSKENLGFAGANNIGIDIAMRNKAEYILLLNNDTVVNEDFLGNLVNVAEKDEAIGVVGGKIYYYYEKNLLWYAGAKINEFTGKTKHIGDKMIDNGQFDFECDTDYITGCMMLVKREAIEKVGGMNPEYFLYYEETDWNIKIKKAGYRLVYTPKSIIYHKVSASTKKINYIMNYYYDRNVYYFVMNNFKIKNRVFMYIYKRFELIMKYIKCILLKDKNKREIILKTLQSINKNEMGKYEC